MFDLPSNRERNNSTAQSISMQALDSRRFDPMISGRTSAFDHVPANRADEFDDSAASQQYKGQDRRTSPRPEASAEFAGPEDKAGCRWQRGGSGGFWIIKAALEAVPEKSEMECGSTVVSGKLNAVDGTPVSKTATSVKLSATRNPIGIL
ncbi:hypothetical protein HPP92_003736 [Vanilla planifolia]|uniref:Uncharacterized protein n=1 Tax=Vanilla planifolia TaxID=51239 RepID=A0A835VK79_VANPL|nr:hypothetical protein HPP92_003736 [Vanilla planifolia]